MDLFLGHYGLYQFFRFDDRIRCKAPQIIKIRSPLGKRQIVIYLEEC